MIYEDWCRELGWHRVILRCRANLGFVAARILAIEAIR